MAPKTTPETDEEEGPRAFANFLTSLDDGRFHAELSIQLHTLVAAMEMHASNYRVAHGELSVALKFSVNERGVVKILADCKAKPPKAKREEAVMWTTKGGNLSASNPRQQRLPIRAVAEPADVRSVTIASEPVRTI